MSEEHVDAFELLKEEMGMDEIAFKVNAIHRLSTIVLSIGLPQTYDKLIPYLDSMRERER